MKDTKWFAELLRSRGVDVSYLKVGEYGLRASDALAAVDQLRSSGVGILGGDVYVLKVGQVQSAYSYWSTNRLVADSDASYVSRSCDETKTYISNYPKRADEEPLFVLVIER